MNQSAFCFKRRARMHDAGPRILSPFSKKIYGCCKDDVIANNVIHVPLPLLLFLEEKVVVFYEKKRDAVRYQLNVRFNLKKIFVYVKDKQ